MSIVVLPLMKDSVGNVISLLLEEIGSLPHIERGWRKPDLGTVRHRTLIGGPLR
jgi:hypothetical protein